MFGQPTPRTHCNDGPPRDQRGHPRGGLRVPTGGHGPRKWVPPVRAGGVPRPACGPGHRRGDARGATG